MAGRITLRIALYGAFREYGHEEITLELPAGSTIPDVQHSLQAELNVDAALIQNAVLADDTSILQHDTVFNDNQSLAILPPVCGG